MKNIEQEIENIVEKYYFKLDNPEIILGEIKIYLDDLVSRGELQYNNAIIEHNNIYVVI